MSYLYNKEEVYVVELKNKVVGLDIGKYIGISLMYIFRWDMDLGISNATCRLIPNTYLACLKMLRTFSDIKLNYEEQPRYGFNERFIYLIFSKGCHNWRLVYLEITKISSK